MNLWICFRGGAARVLRYWADFDGLGPNIGLTNNSGVQLTDNTGTLLTE